MEDLLERSISLQDVASYYSSPWAWLITWTVYCLIIGTLQCRYLAKNYTHFDDGFDILLLCLAQIFAPLVSVGMIFIRTIETIGIVVTKIYSTES